MDKTNRTRKYLTDKPLALSEIDSDLKNRVENITNEFKNGFDFIKAQEKSVTFFGSARTSEDEKDYQMAKELASRVSRELGYTVFTGGGPGIMEAGNRGAFENGGHSFGLTIKLPEEQVTNLYLNNHFDFYYFFIRKVCLTYSAEAYVYFPGGFGTFDELFEILTLIQTNKIEKVPVILINSQFWKPFDDFIRTRLIPEDKIDPQDTDIYTITDDLDEALTIIKNAPIRI